MNYQELEKQLNEVIDSLIEAHGKEFDITHENIDDKIRNFESYSNEEYVAHELGYLQGMKNALLTQKIDEVYKKAIDKKYSLSYKVMDGEHTYYEKTNIPKKQAERLLKSQKLLGHDLSLYLYALAPSTISIDYTYDEDMNTFEMNNDYRIYKNIQITTG